MQSWMTQLADWMDQKEKSVYSDSVLEIYRNCLKNRSYAKEALQNFDPERTTIAEWQGVSENRNSGVKPTQAETDSSDYFGMLSDSTQQTFLETEVLLQSSEQLQSAYMRVMETYDKY